MSDGIPIQRAGKMAYEAPRVTEEPLDSGGNYVGPTWPERKMSADAGATYGGGGTRGGSIIE